MYLGVFSPGRGYTSLRSPFYHIWCTSTTQLLADRARNHITRTSSPHTHASRHTHPESIQVRSMLCMSMTVDTAIRIGLHSAEVVQLYPCDMLSLHLLQTEERIIPRPSKHLSYRAFLRDTPSTRDHVQNTRLAIPSLEIFNRGSDGNLVSSCSQAV